MLNLRTAFMNVPPTVKIIVFVIVLISGLGTVQRVKQWQDNGGKDEEVVFPSNILPEIAMVPGFALRKFWTFLTAGFLEADLIAFLGSILMILMIGKYLERAWGSRDFLKFVGIIIIGANVCTFLTYLCEHTITKDTFYLYNVQANGMIGLVGGFFVGLKQLIPEHLIKPVKRLSICRVKRLPSLFILISLACFVLFGLQSQFLLVFYGSFISWVYLRFYKYQDGLRGDRSETFSFASFFPEFIQPAMKFISTLVFNILVILKCCGPIQKKKFAIDLENPPANAPAMPGSVRADVERRRALALKALDARLHNKPNYYPTSPPPFTTSPSSYIASPPNSSSTNNLNNEKGTNSLDNKSIQSDNVLFDAKDHMKQDS